MPLRMLKLNGEKTRTMVFASTHHLWVYGGCSLTTVDDMILSSDCIRNLGIHMDPNLTMTDQVTVVWAACNHHLHRSNVKNTALCI